MFSALRKVHDWVLARMWLTLKSFDPHFIGPISRPPMSKPGHCCLPTCLFMHVLACPGADKVLSEDGAHTSYTLNEI